ncbi:MAG: hypothetical protein QHH04_00145 [Methanolinea sp.]|nr:hypothetical protein [Methanolinea sp.]
MAGLIIPAWADIQSVVLYKTDFSENPGWMTNSPSRYYWDSDREMYHFKTEGGTNGYAYVPLKYDDQSFSLDYDVIVLVSKPDSAFRFGLTSSEMDFSRGTTILSALENGKYGKLFSLRVIDQNNQLREISSYYASYCGELTGCNTVEFQENTTYHVTVRYNKELRNADIKVVRKDTGEVVFGYFVPVAKELLFMDRLAITTRGDYFAGPYSEGYIDNVELSVLTPVTPAPTPSPTTVPVTSTPTTTLPTPSMERTTSPTPTQTAPVPALVAVVSLAASGIAVSRRLKKG